jgi:hypothetical protein
VRVNGSDATGGSDISFANTTGIVGASQNISIAAGDLVNCVSVMTLGSTPTAGTASVSIVFAPTTGGNFVIPYGCPGVAADYLMGAGNRFFPLHAGNVAGDVTEADIQTMLTDDFAIKKAYAWVSPAPGTAPAKYTMKLRKDTADCSSPFTVTFDDNTQGPKSSSDDTYTPTLWSMYDILGDPDNTPADAFLIMSYLGYINPGAAGQLTASPSDNVEWD